jgi:hypothetical protein
LTDHSAVRIALNSSIQTKSLLVSNFSAFEIKSLFERLPH